MPLMKGRSASSFGRRSNHFMISAWTRRPDFRTDTRLVGLEVVPEQAGESLGRRVIGRSVAPGVTWQEDFPGRAGTLGYHVKPEHGVSLRLRLRQRSAVDAFDDGPGALEADALAHTVRTASPAGAVRGSQRHQVVGPTPVTSTSSDLRQRCRILGDSLLQIEEHPLAAQRLAHG